MLPAVAREHCQCLRLANIPELTCRLLTCRVQVSSTDIHSIVAHASIVMWVTLGLVLPAAFHVRLDRASVVHATGVIAFGWSAPVVAEQLEAQQPLPSGVLYAPPSVKGVSSPEALALMYHLQKIGAKMYGAYWCSHCYDQKVAFGAGAVRLMNYVECAEDGVRSQRSTCQMKEIKGYPTWEIDGKLYPGERSLEDLAEISGFKGRDQQRNKAQLDIDPNL